METKENNQVQENIFECLLKLFGVKNFRLMEEFCKEIELVYSMVGEKNLNRSTYFEYLNDIKNDIEFTEGVNNSVSDDSENIEKTSTDMDVDVVSMDSILAQLINEAQEQKTNEKLLNKFENPIYNVDFYCIFLILQLINDKVNSARFLYKRLPKELTMNPVILFLRNIIDLSMKNNIGQVIQNITKFKIKEERCVDGDRDRDRDEDKGKEKMDDAISNASMDHDDEAQAEEEKPVILDPSHVPITRHTMFIEELLVCLTKKIRERQIRLIGKAYDHIQVGKAAQYLGLSISETVQWLVKEKGWKLETTTSPASSTAEANNYIIPQSTVKAKKQEISMAQMDQLTNYLIHLEESDELTKF